MRLFVVPEVLVSIVVPSDEVTMVPEPPTPTNTIVALSVPALAVLDELLFFAQEMKVKLKRSIEKMMSICLTWVPISGLGKPKLYQNLGCFTMCVGVLI